MNRFLLALIAILPLICSAEVYKWTDENGRVHFGDKPKDKDQAEQLSLKINSYESVSYESLTPTQGATSKRVIMYSAAWCGYCKQARRTSGATASVSSNTTLRRTRTPAKLMTQLAAMACPSYWSETSA
ncbi:DUF4124 domain-containing protein [Pseudomonas sp. zfem001]|uniref:DUF4124 domain-containing protein n=1 Tax=Pseudomonas sp. zfem001 TaxID=3078196 RepID=UPI0029280C42|nr:DUF4124 domain-containing protein [Pseudomonas sp. zfem001]MDU9406608.1 DUF4124 domain-containing protein [Pseudomonas sp. zfem001]